MYKINPQCYQIDGILTQHCEIATVLLVRIAVFCFKPENKKRKVSSESKEKRKKKKKIKLFYLNAMMRLKYAKLLTILVLALNVILIFYTWKWFLSNESTNSSTVDARGGDGQRSGQKDRTHTTIKHIKKTITIIFRDFYHFENDLHHSIESILNLIPNIPILVIYEDEPYPPLNFMNNYTVTHPNVKFINLNFDIRKTSKALSPLTQIRTKYILFVPDSFRFGGRGIIHKMLNEIEKKTVNNKKTPSATKSTSEDRSGVGTQQQTDSSSSSSDANANNDKNKAPMANTKSQYKKIVIIPFASNVKTMSNCCRINVDTANWTMEYSVKNNTLHCDMVKIICIISFFIHKLDSNSNVVLLLRSFAVFTKACNSRGCEHAESYAECFRFTISRNVLFASENVQSKSKWLFYID